MRAVWIVEGRNSGIWRIVRTLHSLHDAQSYKLACATSYDEMRIVKYERREVVR